MKIDLGPLEQRPRSTGEIVRAIATDTADLVRKEVQLAKLEVLESVHNAVRMVAALAAALLLGMIALIFLALAMSDALGNGMPAWAARLVTAGALITLAGVAVVVGLGIMRKGSLAPTETARTIKEDVEWAKQQLKR